MNALEGFNPDVLLGAFASCLARKALTPIVVKSILEAEGFYEPGKLRLAEFAEHLQMETLDSLRELAGRLAERLDDPEKSKLIEVAELLQRAILRLKHLAAERPTRRVTLTALEAEALSGLWQATQELWKSPHGQRTAWKMVLEGAQRRDRAPPRRKLCL